MRPLSATEAISPAWQHTRNLFALRSWRTVLKIGLVAFCANLGSGFNGNFRNSHMHNLPGMTPEFAGTMVLVVIVMALFSLALSALFFYLASRFQFVMFEIVLRSDTKVAPIWNRYGAATWRWIGLKLLFLLCALVLLLPILIPLGITIFHLVKDPDFHPHFWPILKMFLGFILAFLAFGLVISAAYRLLYDFGLPSMALEGTPLSETVRRVFRLIAAEPGPVFLYLLIYFLLGIVIAIAYLIALALTIVIALIPLGALGAGLWFGLHNAGVLGYVIIGVGAAILGVILLAVIIVAILIMLAYIVTFKQAFALYFLGGRYPLLGSYLEPQPPTPIYEQPIYPPPPQPTFEPPLP